MFGAPSQRLDEKSAPDLDRIAIARGARCGGAMRSRSRADVPRELRTANTRRGKKNS
jgi:hypothetical protein